MNTDQYDREFNISDQIATRVSERGGFINHFNQSNPMLLEICAESDPDLETVEASMMIAISDPNWIPRRRMEQAWLAGAIEVHDDGEESRQSHWTYGMTMHWSKAVDKCLDELSMHLDVESTEYRG